MKFVMTDYHGHRELLAGPDDAGEWFDEQASSIMPHGGCGQTIWFGPAEAPPKLRIDVDIDVGRAALRWSDGSYGVQLDPTVPIAVLESPESGTRDVSAWLARVSVDTARQAVVEYVSTGQRPACLTWSSAPPERPGPTVAG
ncbi:immunity protein Imm1 of predicted polymorphic toxin system [Micromonospora sp. Llam0]|uniref:Imm1 family immunity protein n=1 Tax=Micromonospora sp. Llam0 TaxID=2485143 RepID=UPI000F4A0C1D|nr:Imm1 family immunity protein [Micromonospora sp. Llam0]ROO63041.1 immunity protein Imm1 of predicted polymorphic toxin system [Micromonospora sp. Llam0]